MGTCASSVYISAQFSFFKTIGPTTTATDSEGLFYVFYCKIWSLCISQEL